jgi:hypothetical protein
LRRQTFVHCELFQSAASRRSRALVPVPVWPYTLSGRLPVVALVGRYPANKLMGRNPLLGRRASKGPLLLPRRHAPAWSYGVLARFSASYPPPEGRLTTCYSPFCRFTIRLAADFSHDLHPSSTPPTFALSQDQTLHRKTLCGPCGPLEFCLSRLEARRYSASARSKGLTKSESLTAFSALGHLSGLSKNNERAQTIDNRQRYASVSDGTIACPPNYATARICP